MISWCHHATPGRALACATVLLLLPSSNALDGQQPTANGVERHAITLEQALAEARLGNADLGLSAAQARMAEAELGRARATLLPNASVTSGWMRTSDPVATFGTKLRQGRFSEADFSLRALNDPLPVEDWESRASVAWEPVAPSRWAARSAASHGARAADWSEVRAREATDYRTRVLYFGALRAAEREAAASSALEAAEAVLEQFRRRSEQGRLTDADVLQARAERETARADLAAVRQGREEAAVVLAVHLGWSPEERLPEPVDRLEEPPSRPTSHAVAATGRLDERSDLRAAAERVRAAEGRVSGARLDFLPTLGAFGSWSSHGTGPFEGAGTDWTVGIGLHWSLFEGWGRGADLEAARAGLAAARLERERALREARGEVLLARRGLQAAAESYEAARAAREAAGSGRELMRRRFGEGLATPADLLQAEARARAAEAAAVDALARYHMAAARLRFASGGPFEEVGR